MIWSTQGNEEDQCGRSLSPWGVEPSEREGSGPRSSHPVPCRPLWLVL